MKKLKLEIEIVKIDVTEDWYEIHYKYSLNGAEWVNDMTDGDYENGDTIKEWKQTLKDGLAMEYAFEHVKDNINF